MIEDELRDEDDEAIGGLEPNGVEGTIAQLTSGADEVPAAAVQAGAGPGARPGQRARRRDRSRSTPSRARWS